MTFNGFTSIVICFPTPSPAQLKLVHRKRNKSSFHGRICIVFLGGGSTTFLTVFGALSKSVGPSVGTKILPVYQYVLQDYERFSFVFSNPVARRDVFEVIASGELWSSSSSW